MPEHDGGQPVVVNVGPCRCPDRPHDPAGDTVSLVPRLTVPMGAAAWIALAGAEATLETVQFRLVSVYLRPARDGGAILAWSLTDAAGSPEPVTAESVERLVPWGAGGMELAEAADDLYGGALMRPLLERSSGPSRPSRTAPSTSPSPPSGRPRPSPSRRSSHGTRGAGKRSGDRAR